MFGSETKFKAKIIFYSITAQLTYILINQIDTLTIYFQSKGNKQQWRNGKIVHYSDNIYIHIYICLNIMCIYVRINNIGGIAQINLYTFINVYNFFQQNYCFEEIIIVVAKMFKIYCSSLDVRHIFKFPFTKTRRCGHPGTDYVI